MNHQNVSTVAPAASATAAASLASAQARSSSELPAGSASAAAAAEPQPGSSKKKKTSGKKKPKAQGKPAKKSTIVEVIKKRKKNGAVQWKARYSDGVERWLNPGHFTIQQPDEHHLLCKFEGARADFGQPKAEQPEAEDAPTEKVQQWRTPRLQQQSSQRELSDSDIYTPERILAQRWNPRLQREQYLIEWWLPAEMKQAQYEADRSWELIDNLEGSAEVLAEWKENHPFDLEAAQAAGDPSHAVGVPGGRSW